MKCRLLREERCLPSAEYPGDWQCRYCGSRGKHSKLERCPECNSPVAQQSGRMPAGSIIDHPDAFKLVRMGVAIPEDDECEEAAGRTAEQLIAAQKAQEKVRLGIHPEDYEAYDSGLMRGYAPDGNWIPGPNYDQAAWEERKRNSPLTIVEDE